ncbi:MAG: Sensor histidine kinase RcsC [Chlamydiia bacterium]|nr:Sensor histidine kinase RcsC [Chlamydiia bacterium]MCH9615721.1 Sensor histidine kinase RcsC [Chlamydiia bacterium]MCH9628876.1 Sensor histidine kinase RcsC [Chlamydiia bacterium]
MTLTTILFVFNLYLWEKDNDREQLGSQIRLLKKEAVHFKNLTQILDDQIYLAIITKDFQYKSSFLEYQDQLKGLIQFIKDPGYEELSRWQGRIFTFISLRDYSAAEQTYYSPKFEQLRANFKKEFLSNVQLKEQQLSKAKLRYKHLHYVNFGLIILSLITYVLAWIFFLMLVGRYSAKIIGNLDRSLATLAHDFRSPISSILGYSECLREGLDGPVTDTQAASLLKIENVGHNLLSLMNDLLDVAKIQAGRIQLVLEPLDIGTIMQYAAETIEPQIKAKRLEFKKEIPTERIIAQIDGVKTAEILNNLLQNALKFTEKGSIQLSFSKCDNAVEIYVSDTGKGILEKEKAQVFEAFVQSDLSVNTRTEGVGLGLSIAQHYARMQGGELSFSANEEEGSRFTLRIPFLEGK